MMKFLPFFRMISGEDNTPRSPSFRVISSSNPEVPTGPIDLADLLLSAACTGCTDIVRSKILLQVAGQRTFCVWLSQVPETSTWSFEDGFEYAKKFFQQCKESSTTFQYTLSNDAYQKGGRITSLVSILSLNGESSGSFFNSFQDRLALEESDASSTSHLKKSARFFLRNCFLIVASMTLVLMSLALIIPAIKRHESKSPISPWMHWDLKGTKGPRYQLQFTRPWISFSEWATETKHNKDEWFVRLDDASMVPPHLIDDTERKYQQWFRNRYTEVEAIRVSKDYLNESFYEHPSQMGIKLDRFYHPAHCILVFRRYWQARETGKHVCPRDVDYKHIEHCFNSLDKFIFFEGEQWSEPILTNEDKEFSLAWIPNACF
ncbi:hypothetical protein F5884DRAFT_781776 [Xylogone sp. PMI_703]|nr:hypothetical protein F5884DRAFT_781776 [Xylogone sp. PMI_703]